MFRGAVGMTWVDNERKCKMLIDSWCGFFLAWAAHAVFNT